MSKLTNLPRFKELCPEAYDSLKSYYPRLDMEHSSPYQLFKLYCNMCTIQSNILRDLWNELSDPAMFRKILIEAGYSSDNLRYWIVGNYLKKCEVE